MPRDDDKQRRRRLAVLVVATACIVASLVGTALVRTSGASGIAPPALSPVGLPTDPTTSRSASFMFTSAQTVVFECSLDGSSFTRCGRGMYGTKSYPGPLAVGPHAFEVRATTGRRIVESTVYTWTIVSEQPDGPEGGAGTSAGGSGGRGTGGGGVPTGGGTGSGSGGSDTGTETGGTESGGTAGGGPGTGTSADDPPPGEGMPFTISGDASGLAPGVTRQITLVLHNPNAVPIWVTAVSVAIAADSSPPGCSSADNLLLEQPWGITSSTSVMVPAHGTAEVRRYPRAPRITFYDRPWNQDVCKGKSFTLTYSGSAHS